MKRWSVYCITCTATGRRYVGQTRQSVAVRWAQHIQEAVNFHKPWPLAVALREHGEVAFTVELLAEFPTQKEALAREVAEIAARGTLAPDGYNLTKGGHGRLGLLNTAEWRAGHSKRLKEAAAGGRRWGTNSSEAQRGVWAAYTPEQKAARLAKSEAARSLGPDARWQRVRDTRQADLLPAVSLPAPTPPPRLVLASADQPLSAAETRLRFLGGCSICRRPPGSGFMCAHAYALTVDDIERLRPAAA
jgi:hypothetical protein